ncbi:unnamed protein product, partial [Prorocentrum cordatum]
MLRRGCGATALAEGKVVSAATQEGAQGGLRSEPLGHEGGGSASPQRLRKFDVQVGDVIKVQTNLGWEVVTVTAKRVNGKLDIEFK